ncbi:hypothetical protein MMC27_007480 [Xylographa pallens]|nr:hypothetical protein [Xylographa pallens]
MLKVLTSLLSLTAISVATSASTLFEDAVPKPTTQLSRRSPHRRVYLELDLQLSYAMIHNYQGSPTGPAVLSVYIEADGRLNPSLKFDIRVKEYNNGVILPTPYVEEASFPFIFASEEATAEFVTHGPGIEIYPLGHTAFANHEIMNTRTGKGIVVDLLKMHPAINEKHDANNVVLYLVNLLDLQREGVRPNAGRLMQFVAGSREWYREAGVQFNCDMPLLTYKNRAYKRTFNIELPDAPVVLFPDEVKEFILSIAHKVKPPPALEYFPG